MTETNEVYLGDGLFASYDGFTIWLRAPREHGEHYVAIEPLTLRCFLTFLKDYVPGDVVK